MGQEWMHNNENSLDYVHPYTNAVIKCAFWFLQRKGHANIKMWPPQSCLQTLNGDAVPAPPTPDSIHLIPPALLVQGKNYSDFDS
jgi:hypothetical protein